MNADIAIRLTTRLEEEDLICQTPPIETENVWYAVVLLPWLKVLLTGVT
jgi:hypothetical protein